MPMPGLRCRAHLNEQGDVCLKAGGDGGSQGAQDGGRLSVAPVVQDVAQEESAVGFRVWGLGWGLGFGVGVGGSGGLLYWPPASLAHG